MRLAILTLTVAAALALAACGGDDDNQATTTQPTQTTAKDAGPTVPKRDEGSTGPKGKDGGKGSERSGREPSAAPSGPERRFRGIERANYEISEAVCGTQRPKDAAIRYRSKSERPEAIARAYAKLSYQIPRLRRAAYAGCLAGLSKRP